LGTSSCAGALTVLCRRADARTSATSPRRSPDPLGPACDPRPRQRGVPRARMLAWDRPSRRLRHLAM